MSNTKDGGHKVAQTNYEKYGVDYYSVIGAEGGSKITENTKKRGFGSMSPERRREISSFAGKKSAIKRGKNNEKG